MSALMIIFLILILSIRSSNSSDTDRQDESRPNENTNEKYSQNLLSFKRIKYVGFNRHGNNQYLTRIDKLRRDLQRMMSVITKKIMQRRIMEDRKKWQIRGNKTRTNDVKFIDTDRTGIDEFSVENNEKREKNERQDRNNYNSINGKTYGGTEVKKFRNFFQELETLPSVRGKLARTFRIPERKVRAKFAMNEPRIDRIGENEIPMIRRKKRASDSAAWIERDFGDREMSFNMHALIVRDEDIPPCCSPASEVTDRRYFMCNGAILTLKHVITTASCMHFADIYNHNVEADLGILIGATNPRAYVIKINRYEMHPNYDYDVDSKNHPINNMAIVYLDCGIIPTEITIPKLPKGINDDIGHLCCRQNCDIVTIVQGSDNRHVARIMKARNLPSPKHSDDNEVDDSINQEMLYNAPEFPRSINKLLLPKETFLSARHVRSPLKLAAAPIFFGKKTRGTLDDGRLTKDAKSSNTYKRRRSKTSKVSGRVSNQESTEKNNDPLNFENSADGVKPENVQPDIPNLRALEDGELKVKEQLAAVDWGEIEERMSKKFSAENREAMGIFSKKVVGETMKRLGTVLGDESLGQSEIGFGDNLLGRDNGSFIFAKLMQNKEKNQTISDFVKVFTKVVTSLMPPNNINIMGTSQDLELDEKDLIDPPPIYVECPPLGSPIIIDKILVGLVAYTCDDVQEWVEWKYVNIAKNIDWICTKIDEIYEPMEKCSYSDDSEPEVRSFPKHHSTLFSSQYPWTKNETVAFRGKNGAWSRRDISSERKNDFVKNFENVEIPTAEMSLRVLKDTWFARNSRPAPRERSNERYFANSRIWPKFATARDAPVRNNDTCYIKDDGTTDCETKIQFNGP